jgi:Fe-S cluster assembly protein SufB
MSNPLYPHGFASDVQQDVVPVGLSAEIVTHISVYKNEPAWLLEWRLAAFVQWQGMREPHWASFLYPAIDYQAISYFATPKKNTATTIDPEIERIFEKLGVPLGERAALAGIATDVVLDSVSVATTFSQKLADVGIIFCPISEAIRTHSELARQYLGTVVPPGDNFFACLNAAVFSDGTFVYIPAGVRCPLELSSYFRINAATIGQFERTLIIAEDDSTVSYLEGCTAPARAEHQLHAAVVELVAKNRATIKYSTVQNWYPGDAEGVGGVYNFVTKRGLCAGVHSSISWTQLETGAAATWKYPSCILQGDYSQGEFFSIAATNHYQAADTGTKMIHLGKHTRSRIVSKTICAGQSINTYRGLVTVGSGAIGARSFANCDSLILAPTAQAHTFPTIDVKNATAIVEHEASTGKISQSELEYLTQRGLSAETASALIITGFSREILQKLPLEFALEARKLLEISFENSVG